MLVDEMELLELDASLVFEMESSSRLMKLLREMVCSEMSLLVRLVLEGRTVDLEDLVALA